MGLFATVISGIFLLFLFILFLVGILFLIYVIFGSKIDLFLIKFLFKKQEYDKITNDIVSNNNIFYQSIIVNLYKLTKNPLQRIALTLFLKRNLKNKKLVKQNE